MRYIYCLLDCSDELARGASPTEADLSLTYDVRRPDMHDFSDPATAFDQILVASLARDSARDSARVSARDSARVSARDSARDSARYQRTSALLESLSLPIHRRWEAFDSSIPDNYKNMKLQSGAKMTGSLGAIGCAESR
jgi:hypothetical protein